jgi:hypothetical protein
MGHEVCQRPIALIRHSREGNRQRTTLDSRCAGMTKPYHNDGLRSERRTPITMTDSDHNDEIQSQ